jgi:hypothetical protein
MPWFGRNRRPLVLFHNDFFGRDPAANPPAECASECEFTSDRARFPDADVVVFHVPTLTGLTGLRKRRNQVWVAWSYESEVYYPQLQMAGFLRQFDWTATYRLDSDIPVLYVDPAVAEALRTPPAGKSGEAPAVLFTSNAAERSGRTAYLEELSRHLATDSYGKHMRNKELPEDRGRQTKLDTTARYKFTLAFENSITRDYVTEKFYDPLIAGSVPVYMGAPNIDEFAPDDHCFINAANFASPADLADYLKTLDADTARYGEYLAWKQKPFRPRFLELVESQRLDFRCRLCRKLRGP